MIITETAFAKINLYLDVLGCRNDGFHDIFSLMHSVSLSDDVTVGAEPAQNIEISLITNVPSLPVDESNLAYRAVKSYLSYFNIKAKINLTIEKNIPIGAGLGGGSSDAAAALRAMNRLFGKADRDQLLSIASDLGSDVPFCLVGGLAACTGRGERIFSLQQAEPMSFVVAIGESRISTPKAYAALDLLYDKFKASDKAEHYSDSRVAEMVSCGNLDLPSYNIFEQVVNSREIDEIKEIMKKNGAEFTLMSGSGPSVFGRFSNIALADEACGELIDKGYTAFVCHSVYPEVEI